MLVEPTAVQLQWQSPPMYLILRSGPKDIHPQDNLAPAPRNSARGITTGAPDGREQQGPTTWRMQAQGQAETPPPLTNRPALTLSSPRQDERRLVRQIKSKFLYLMSHYGDLNTPQPIGCISALHKCKQKHGEDNTNLFFVFIHFLLLISDRVVGGGV